MRESYRKLLLILIASFVLLSGATSAFAENFHHVKIYPENVGIFTSVGEQQFVAIGYYDADEKSGENITLNVDWISGDESALSIDENGLAKVLKPYGRFFISISYPKKGAGNAGPNYLLLKKSLGRP